VSGVVDLMRELIAAQADHRVDEILERRGVAGPDVRLHCGLARARSAGKFYEPDPDGEYAIIVPVMNGDELVDLIAFDPRQPAEWFVRLGGEPLLGAGALADQLLEKPLHIFKTPLSWLQGGCAGVVVADQTRAFVDLATSPNGLVGEDDAHTDELRQVMTETALRRLPRFLVRQREAA
jgi:hypothetical protein